MEDPKPVGHEWVSLDGYDWTCKICGGQVFNSTKPIPIISLRYYPGMKCDEVLIWKIHEQ